MQLSRISFLYLRITPFSLRLQANPGHSHPSYPLLPCANTLQIKKIKKKMLKPQLHQSRSTQILFLHKPFIHGSRRSTSLPIWSRPSLLNKHRNVRVGLIPSNTKAVSSSSSSSSDSTTTTKTTSTTTMTTTPTTIQTTPTTPTTPTTTTTTTIVTTEVVTEKFISVKATITVTLTVGGFLTHLGLTRGLDDITDMLGQSLLLELVSAELDPSKYGVWQSMHVHSNHSLTNFSLSNPS